MNCLRQSGAVQSVTNSVSPGTISWPVWNRAAVLLSRRGRDPGHSRAQGAATVEWVGYSDGRYNVQPAAQQRDEIGTTVSVVPRRGAEYWVEDENRRDLATLYGSILPFSVTHWR